MSNPSSDKNSELGFATRAVHAGQAPDPTTGAIMTPIYQTSTYVQEWPDKHKGFDYSRAAHPTRQALEENLASLESAKFGLCFASGVAATSTVVEALSSGDHVLCGNDLYGGTYRVFTKVFARFGMTFSFVDTTDLAAVEAAFTPKTKLVWIESPSNPLLRICDIRALAKLAHAKGVKLVVDNTFASPALQRPLELGADVVVHSTTKYLGGHSDVIGGAILTSDKALHEEYKFLQKSVGAVPGPLDCFLLLRGTKTLPLRVERHCLNAGIVAKHLLAHPEIAKVHYPGLPTHPGHEIAKSQMSGFGGMISFELKGDLERAKRMISSCKIFALAESLGGVESLISHPASMTHGSIPREERLKAGLNDGLIRLSVGVEDAADLTADLDSALVASLKGWAELPAALRPGATSRWARAITEDDVARFADISGDRGRHHLERDEKGRLMAHGLLTATLPTKLGGDMNYIARTMDFEFVKPVYSGDTLTCDGVVVSAAVQSERYKVRFSFEVRNQDGVIVLRGDTTGQIKR